MIEVQKNHKNNKQMEKLGQLPPYCSKFLENGLTGDNVKNICNVNLKHHPIRLGIQNGRNTMDHDLTTSFNHHPKLIWWQMKSKHNMKL